MDSIKSLAETITYDGCMHNHRKSCRPCTQVAIEKFVEQLLSFSTIGTGVCIICENAKDVKKYGRLPVCFECYYSGNARALLIKADTALELLDLAKCPDCDGSGIYLTGEDCVQCLWCQERKEILTY